MQALERQTAIAYAEKAVPRYTSYPTANHFSPSVGPAHYRNWLGALKPECTLSLYVHVPFCRSLCWYCGCHTSVTKRDDRLKSYVDCLLTEMDLVAALLPEGPTVTHIHFGGGTPTYLDPDDLSAVLTRLRHLFHVSPGAEIAVEVDPRCLTAPMASAMGEGGVTRASLGVQDVSPEVQALINRIQPRETVEKCVDRLRGAGIESLNFDIMYGLPGQSVRHVEETVAATVALRPARYAVFGYAHVPWFKSNQRAIDENAIPGTEERLDQAVAAERMLVSQGYTALGMDHFALPGDTLVQARDARRLRRNFQGYTDDSADALLGFGASAISALPRGYVQSDPRIGSYEESVRRGRLAAVRGVELTAEDMLRRAAIERIMCDFELDSVALCEQFGRPPAALDPALAALRPLADDGLVSVVGRKLAVTDLGRRLIRHVAACFDERLQLMTGRHSRAV